MFESCIQKQNKIKMLFAAFTSDDEKYQKIIDLGRTQPDLDQKYKNDDNIVKGCQSTVYLRSYMNKGKIYFEACSEALISAGLAQLLTQVYSGETPEAVLKCPPDYLEELGIHASLTPNRASGLLSMHLHMKQDALRFYMENQK